MKKLLLISVLLFSYSLFGQVATDSTQAPGLHSSAINYYTVANGISSFASGHESKANGNYSTAIGHKCIADGVASVALGQQCLSKSQGYSFGQSCKALAEQSIAIGRFVETTENSIRSMVIGNCTSAHILVNDISNSIMIGAGSTKPTIFISEAESYNGVGKVGIGTTEPVARFQVSDGDVFIEDINSGIIMKSPDGSCWRGTLNNEGQLMFSQLPDCLTVSNNKINDEHTDIKIFPNPASGFIQISLDDESLKKYSKVILYNTKGCLLVTEEINSSIFKLSIPEIEPGAYIVSLKGATTGYSETIIIK